MFPQKPTSKNKGFNLQQHLGFTMIEILLVISIIALLSSFVLVALSSARSSTRDAKRIADIKQIASALELYFDRFDQYPFNGQGGYDATDVTTSYGIYYYEWDSSCGGNNPNDEFLTPLRDAGIMPTLPDDPSFTNQNDCYWYSSSKYKSLPPPSGGSYLNGYYLTVKLENIKNIQNNCDITFNPPDRFCLSQKH